MNSKLYTIDSVGEIEVVKNSLSRHISLKLRAGRLPKVVIPRLMPFEMGYRFALEKTDWIIENRKKLESVQPRHIYDETNPFFYRNGKIEFDRHNSKYTQSVRLSNGYKVLLPQKTDFNIEETQKFIRNIIIELLRHEAKLYLPTRIQQLAIANNFSYNNLTIKNMHSKWGSCSSTNNINLSIYLMCLPEYLSDFIILHELCHTIHKNHGAQFHELLNKLVGGREKLLDKELNTYKIQL